MTAVTYFKQFFLSHRLAAIYTQNNHSLYELKFYHLIVHSNDYIEISNHELNCDNFFLQLLRDYKIGKNEFLQQFHRLHSEPKQKIIIDIPSCNKKNVYILIKDVMKYID